MSSEKNSEEELKNRISLLKGKFASAKTPAAIALLMNSTDAVGIDPAILTAFKDAAERAIKEAEKAARMDVVVGDAQDKTDETIAKIKELHAVIIKKSVQVANALIVVNKYFGSPSGKKYQQNLANFAQAIESNKTLPSEFVDNFLDPAQAVEAESAAQALQQAHKAMKEAQEAHDKAVALAKANAAALAKANARAQQEVEESEKQAKAALNAQKQALGVATAMHNKIDEHKRVVLKHLGQEKVFNALNPEQKNRLRAIQQVMHSASDRDVVTRRVVEDALPEELLHHLVSDVSKSLLGNLSEKASKKPLVDVRLDRASRARGRS